MTEKDQFIKQIAEDLRYIRGRFDSLPCTENRVLIEKLDGRLTPIEKIFWKIMLRAITAGGLAGTVAAAIVILANGWI